MSLRKRSWLAVTCACALLLVAVIAWFNQRAPAPRSAPASTSSRSASVMRLAFQHARAIAPASLAGTVRTSGAVVSGALVCAACAGCEAIGAKASACVRSAGNGRYEFATLAPGSYHVHASADGYAPASALGGKALTIVASEARADVDILLAPGGGQLTGTVLDATGGPVPHARVRAVRLAPPQYSLDVESDDAGRFALSLAEGSVLLAAEAEGYAPSRANFVAPSRDVKLVLTPGAGVSGTVIAGSDGKPLPGIEVRAVPSSNRNAPFFASALSDEQGAFRIEGLEPGSYALSARGEPWFGERSQSVDLGLGDHLAGVELALSAAAEVSGRVLLDDGRPCEQGYVGLRTSAPPPPLAAGQEPGPRVAFLGLEQIAEIQPDGAVDFPGVLPAFYGVTVRCMGRLLREGPRQLQVGRESLADLTWTVAVGSALLVHVVDGRKQPVAFAPFVLRFLDESGRRAITVYRGDAQGSFEVPGLAPGSYEVTPYQPAAPGAAASVELRAEQARAEVTLQLVGNAAIEVAVESFEGAPRDDVRVTVSAEQPAIISEPQPARPLPATALGNGRFRFAPIPAGTYIVSVDDGVNPPVRAPANEGRVHVAEGAAARVEVQLPRGVSLSGRVSDERGAPAANVWVSASRAADDASGAAAPVAASVNRVLTDGEGRFVLDGLVQGMRYTLRAAEPYGSATSVHDVTPGSDVHVRLPAPATLAGVAVDVSGRPARQFLVQAISQPSGSKQEHTIVDAHGRFSLGNLAPGRVAIALSTPYGESGRAQVELAPGARQEGLRIVVQSVEELAAGERAATPSPQPL